MTDRFDPIDMFQGLAIGGAYSCTIDTETKFGLGPFKGIMKSTTLGLSPAAEDWVRKEHPGLTFEKLQQAVKFLNENQTTLESIQLPNNHLTRFLSDPIRYEREETLKQQITKAIKSHGYFRERKPSFDGYHLKFI